MWKLSQRKLLKVKKIRNAKTHIKKTATPRINSRVIEVKVRLRRDVAVLAAAKPGVERMRRRR